MYQWLYKAMVYIQNKWRKHNSDYLYEGIWFALHEPMDADAYALDTSVVKVWFIRNHCIEEKKLIDFKVFLEHGIGFERIYKIAYSNTALVKRSNLIYIGYQLGGLWGRGMLFELNRDGELEQKGVLWIS
ncbi:MAG: hypothetical protein N2645_08630 [Clostridia bacterium]|nr:hypothetical protein [Clostridia bacterium]